MKKLLDRIRRINLDLRILLIVIIIIVNVLLLFKPGVFKNKNSYIGIRSKKEELENINRNIMQETNSNTDMTMEIADLREQDASLEKRAMINRKEIDPNGLEFHLPSILIRLEDSSKANGLSISIKYSEIAYQDIQGKEIEPNIEDGNKEDKTDEDSNDSSNMLENNSEADKELAENKFDTLGDQLEELDRVSNKEDKAEEDSDESLEEEEDDDLEDKMIEESKERFKEEGVEVTQIPIEVKGTYAGVKRFIKDLDKLNYLEPSKVEIKSLGQTVEANIIINIFHGDIFR